MKINFFKVLIIKQYTFLKQTQTNMITKLRRRKAGSRCAPRHNTRVRHRGMVPIALFQNRGTLVEPRSSASEQHFGRFAPSRKKACFKQLFSVILKQIIYGAHPQLLLLCPYASWKKRMGIANILRACETRFNSKSDDRN